MRQRTAIRVALIGVLLVALPLAIVRCNIWGDGDSALPVFIPGELTVTPKLYVFPYGGEDVDATASLPESTFVIEARDSSGLGAESVPVRVSIGLCGSRARVVVAADGSPDGAADASDAQLVIPGLRRFESLVELVAIENGGCKNDASSFLRCTLSASGISKFAVRPRAPVTPTYGQQIPICVAVNGGPSLEVAVSIAQGLDGGALAFRMADRLTAGPPVAARECSVLVTDCATSPPRRAEATLQLTSANGIIVPSEPTVAQVTVTDGNPRVWLSPDDCSSNQRPAALQVLLPAGAGASRPFSVCTDAREGPFTLAASIVSQPGVRGTFDGGADFQVGQFVIQNAGVNGGTSTVVGRLADCEGKAIPNSTIAFRSLDPSILSVGADASTKTDNGGLASFTYNLSADAGPGSVLVTAGANAQTCFLFLRGGGQ